MDEREELGVVGEGEVSRFPRDKRKKKKGRKRRKRKVEIA